MKTRIKNLSMAPGIFIGLFVAIIFHHSCQAGVDMGQLFDAVYVSFTNTFPATNVQTLLAEEAGTVAQKCSDATNFDTLYNETTIALTSDGKLALKTPLPQKLALLIAHKIFPQNAPQMVALVDTDSPAQVAADQPAVVAVQSSKTGTAVDTNVAPSSPTAGASAPKTNSSSGAADITNRLAAAIIYCLTYEYPVKTNQAVIGEQSYRIASQCAVTATNQNALVESLTNALGVGQGLPISTNDILPASVWVADKTIYSVDQPALFGKGQGLLPYQVFLSGGAEFQNPYRIDASSHSVTNSGSSTVAYLQFDYINRFILRDPDKLLASKPYWQLGNFNILGGNFVNPLKTWPDIQVQLGFVFGNGSSGSNTQYSATTLAGSGDFYDDARLGLPIWRQLSADMTLRQQVSLELDGGFVTEKIFERLHPNMFVGMGYETAFVPAIGFSSTNTPGFFIGKAGVGWIDTPRMQNNTVVFNSATGTPEYDWDVHPTIQAFLAYPLSDSIFFTVEAEAYFAGSPPDSWTVKVGATIPLDKVATAFGSFIK